MNRRDILLAKLKAKQLVRKAKEHIQQQKGIQNATQPNPQPTPTNQPNGLNADNGTGQQP